MLMQFIYLFTTCISINITHTVVIYIVIYIAKELPSDPYHDNHNSDDIVK